MIPGYAILCRLATCAALGGLLSTTSTQAQIPSTLTVTAVDPTGAVIPHATVVLEKGTTEQRTKHAGPSGAVTFDALTAGRYTVRVESRGLASGASREVLLQTEEAIQVTVRANMAGRSEHVTVTAVDTTSYAVPQLSPISHLTTPLLETPQNIVSVSSQVLRDQQATNISDALKDVSGVNQGTPNPFIRPKIYIRGFSADQNKLHDGVGGFTIQPYEDTAIIDHVEFIKGPAGFVLANAQPGGVLNIVTKQPVRNRETDLDLQLGTASLYRGTLDSGGTLTRDEKLYYRLNAAANRERTATRFYGFDRFVLAPALAYDPTPKTHLLFEYNLVYGKNIAGTDPSLPGVNAKYFALPNDFSTADYTLPDGYVHSHYLRAQVEQSLTPNWKLTAQGVRYLDGRLDWNLYEGYDDIKTLDETGIFNRHLDLWNTRTHASVLQAFSNGHRRTGAVQHNILAGVDIAKVAVAINDGDDPTSFGLNTRNPVYGTPFSTYLAGWTVPNNLIPNKYGSSSSWQGTYVQDSFKIGSRWVITGAGRYTHYNTPPSDGVAHQSFDAFTPRGGVNFLITPSHSLYGLFDQSFLAQPGSNYAGRPFKPLRGNNVEFGYKGQWLNGRLLANASVYRIVLNNLLASDPVHPNFSIQQDRKVVCGFDGDINGEIAPRTDLVANYAYNKALTRTSDGGYDYPSQDVPAHNVNVWLKHRFPRFNGLGAAVAVNAQLRRAATSGEQNVVYLPDYALLNGALSYPLRERLVLEVNVNNILNERYIPGGGYYSDAFSVPAWLYLPSVPRTANFNLRYRF